MKSAKTTKRYFLMVKDMDCHTSTCFTDNKVNNIGQAYKEMWPNDYDGIKEEFGYKKDTDFDGTYLLVDFEERRISGNMVPGLK